MMLIAVPMTQAVATITQPPPAQFNCSSSNNYLITSLKSLNSSPEIWNKKKVYNFSLHDA